MSVPRGHFKFWCCYSKFIPKFLPSVSILPRFRVDFLSFAFCNYLASIPYLCSVFLHSVIILARFHVGFLSFAFCNYLASIPCWAFCNYLASNPYLYSVFCILWLSCLDSILIFWVDQCTRWQLQYILCLYSMLERRLNLRSRAHK